MSLLTNIPVSQLYPHPDNPRKDVGDVSELAESVRKNGIMQNLTVITKQALEEPEQDQPSPNTISRMQHMYDFVVLIGHRRLAAAKEAGLQEVPCKIVSQISKKEQIGIMLEENMQRNDLTIYEQAQGFQMMLDLGETAQTIQEKTGFSKTTIYHRLNLAKIDQEELKKKEEQFQMSISDFYELEKISDIEKRNKIFKSAANANDLKYKVALEIQKEKTERYKKIITEKMEKLGIVKATSEVLEHRYRDYDYVKGIEISESSAEEDIFVKNPEELYYIIDYNRFSLYRKKEEQEENQEQPQRKKEEQEKTARIDKIKAYNDQISEEVKLFIDKIIDGSIEEVMGIEGEIINELVELESWIDWDSVLETMGDESDSDLSIEELEKRDEEIKERFKNLSVQRKLFVLIRGKLSFKSTYCYDVAFREDTAEEILQVCRLIEKYGFTSHLEPEMKKILDGSSELYTKENHDADQ